jgi:hypothetical protein
MLFLNGCYTTFGTTKRDSDVDLDGGIEYSDYQNYDNYDEYYDEPNAYQEYDTVYVEEDPIRFDPDREVIIQDVQYRPKYVREIYYTNDYDPYYDEYYYNSGPAISLNIHIGSYWYPPSWWYRPYYWSYGYHPYWWWNYGYVTIYPPYCGPYWGYWYPYPVYWADPYYYHNNPSHGYKELVERKKRDWRKREPRPRQPVTKRIDNVIADNSLGKRSPVRKTTNNEQVNNPKRDIPTRDGSIGKRQVSKDNGRYTGSNGNRQVKKTREKSNTPRTKRYVKTRNIDQRHIQDRNAPRKVYIIRKNPRTERENTATRKISSNKRYSGGTSSVSKRDNSNRSKPIYNSASKTTTSRSPGRSVTPSRSNSGSSRSSGVSSSSRSSSSSKGSSSRASSSRGSRR